MVEESLDTTFDVIEEAEAEVNAIELYELDSNLLSVFDVTNEGQLPI